MRQFDAKLVPAKSFAGFDDQAILFLQQPFHSCLFSASGVNRLGRTLTLKLNGVSVGDSLVGGWAIEGLNFHHVFLAVPGEQEKSSLGPSPFAEPCITRAVQDYVVRRPPVGLTARYR